MVKLNSTNLAAVALNFQGSDVPEWIQLIPAGPAIVGRDGRRWTLPDPETIIAAFQANNADLPVDFEHSTQHKAPKGDFAPAVGWIKDMEVRNAALWAKVEWTQDGQAAVASKGYRYVSPVFTFEKETGVILQMISAGLTNNPNLEMAALNAAGTDEEIEMDKAILEALGLAANTLRYSGDTWVSPKPHDEGEAVAGLVDWESGEIRSNSMIEASKAFGEMFASLGGVCFLLGSLYIWWKRRKPNLLE